jgi:hypothetical protein
MSSNGGTSEERSRTDWTEWHESYTDPRSALSQRLKVIQRHIREFLDERVSPETRALSVCAGDGRDLIEPLAEHPMGTQVTARLIEREPSLVEQARARTRTNGLNRLEVLCADAGVTDVYAGLVPAELVLVCGVFGNITDTDLRRTIRVLPQLCANGGIVIWTRHRHAPDLTPRIRRWFADSHFRERAFHSPAPDSWSVGVHEFDGHSEPLVLGTRLFTFVR